MQLTVAHDSRARTRQVTQRRERAAGAPLLQHRDGDHGNQRRGENQRFAEVAEHYVERHRHAQQKDHGLGEHAKDQAEQAMVAFRRQGIRTLRVQPPRGLARAQSRVGASGRTVLLSVRRGNRRCSLQPGWHGEFSGEPLR